MIKGVLLGLAGLTMVATVGHAGVLKSLSSEEENWTEEPPNLKAHTAAVDEKAMQEFALILDARYRYFIDKGSLSVEKDGVVHFTLAIKTQSDRLQVSHAGLRCATKEWKTYALASSDGTWRELPGARWELIEPKSRDSYRSDLYWRYLCAGGAPAGDAEDLLQRLRKRPEFKTRQ